MDLLLLAVHPESLRWVNVLVRYGDAFRIFVL